MTLRDEHEAKVTFINRMPNKYDYLAYKQFCIDNDFEVMTFLQYAAYVEPYEPPTITDPRDLPEPRKTGCCGGGEVR